jgi:ribosomal protein S1
MATAKKQTKKAEVDSKKATAKKAVPADKQVSKTKKLTMEELLNSKSLMVPKKGDTVEGTVTYKDHKLIRVNIGAKTDAVISDKEFDFMSDYIEQIKVGDKLKAIVYSTEDDRGQIVLSIKGSVNDAKWKFFEDALENSGELEAKGLELNKGGLIVLVSGVRGFVPSSQFGRKYVGKIAQLKGKSFKVQAIEVDREKNRLIFSERHVSEATQLAQREQALKVVKEESVYEGVISGVMPFGLFVTVEVPINDKKTDDKSSNIGYVEGLIHISEISWEKVNHPKDFHQVGDRVKVKVLGVDVKTGKLNLSIKQLQDDPWTEVAKEYKVGTTFTGKVSRIEPFGVFVNIKPGVDGLIHSTKLDPNQNLTEDQEISVTVESVEPELRRMSLSTVLTEVPMGYK